MNPILTQVDAFKKELNEIDFVKRGEPYHLICHSQGTLVCRTYLETTANHTVQNFISIAGPQMGQFGFTNWWEVSSFCILIENQHKFKKFPTKK